MEKKDIESFYPLSPTQQGMLFHSLAAPASGMYAGQVSFRLEGRLDVVALRRAWSEVTRRHGALRTAFRWRDLKEPIQVVSRRARSTFVELDWRRLDQGHREQCRSDLLRADLEHGFDLTRAPLVRMTLLRLSDRVAELLWTRHHLIVDGWSVSLLFQELLRRYRALSSGTPLPIEPAPRYRDYIAWLRRQDPAQGEALWRRELAGLEEPAVFDYGTAEDPGATGERRWGDAQGEVPWSITAGLTSLGRGRGVTLATLVQGAWGILLGRYQDRDDVLFGTVMSGRPTELDGVQGMVGLFINTQPLRVRTPRHRSFLDWIVELQQHLSELRRGEHLALHQIQGWSAMPRGQAMFETLLVYENYPVDPLLLGSSREVSREQATQDLGHQGLAADELRIVREHSRERTNYPLTLVLRQGQTLPMSVMFDRSRMAGADVERMLRHLTRLLEGIAEDPRRPLGDLPWLSAAEVQQLVVEWDGPEIAGAASTLDELVRRQAERSPDAPAVEQADQRISYRQLMQGAEAFAAVLAAAGVRPGDRVGVGLERSPALLVALLAVLRAGAAYVPLDPAYPRARLALMVEDAELAALLAEEGSELAALAPAGCPVLSLDPAAAEEAAEEAAEATAPAHAASADAPAYMIYTSGSTGRPKGVLVPHGAVVNFLTAMAAEPGLGPADTLVAVTSLSFDISVLELFLPLTVGARVVLADRQEAADGRRLRQLLKDSGATVLQATPATWRLLTASGFRARPPFRQLCGGEALGRELAQQLTSGGAELWNLYGPTETTIWSVVTAVGPGPVHLGRAIARTRLRVLDRHRQLLPVGVPGELAIGGAGVAQGYFRRPGLTAERFIPDPFATTPGARLYRTGDLVRRRADGTLDYLGRLDFQVKVRGHRIELGEVEAVLEALDEVAAAVAVVRRDGSGEGRLVAYVVPAPGAAPTIDGLRRRAGADLPAVMVPAVFVLLERLPLTPNGKVDRRALPEPGSERPELETPMVQPHDEAEKTLAEIWCRVLQLDEVGLNDNFFDLGGHSILAIRVHEEIQRAFDTDLGLIELFEYPTVAALAQRLDRRPTAAASAAASPQRRRPVAATADVAVIGLAGRFPGATDPEGLWHNLCAGVESVRDLSDQEIQELCREAGIDPRRLDDPSLVKRRGCLDDLDRFDAPFFGINPREAELMDPQHRLFLEVAVEALDRAGHPDETAGAIGVFAGTSLSGYLLHNVFPHLAGRGFDTPWPMVLGNDKDHLATRVSYLLGLTGPSLLVQTACSTGLVAVHMARRALLAGECDLAIAGAASIRIPQNLPHPFHEGGINSPDGRCRPFDAAAQGTVGGNGVGAVVLRRLDDALADGDTIHAVLRGSALNNDGNRKVGYTAPSVEGQARVIRAALDEADVDPATIGFVEAHGTGTALGDPIEVEALHRAFAGGEAPLPPDSCALGSIKGNLGHLDTAAGIAGLIKAVLAVEAGLVPPTVHFERPSPRIPWAAGPFFVPRELTPWPDKPGPRRAGVSSFGLGGTNVHAILEQAPGRETPEQTPEQTYALVLSAKTASALELASERLAGHLRRHPELSLADVEHTLAVGRRGHLHRRAIFADDREQALDALEGRDPARVRTSELGRGGSWTVFLFPGQGTAWAGMGRWLFEHQPVFRRALEECDEILRPPLGESLLDALYGPGASDDALADTRLAQPAVFALSHAWAELWASWGVRPDFLLGHSLGEYVAAQRAGIFGLESALRLVARRGALMQQLPTGGMLALGISADRFRELLDGEPVELGGAVELAAENGPEAVVVSGPEAAIAAVAERWAQRGISGRRLRTSHAFHSAMMDPVLDAFREEVSQHRLGPPQAPVLSNVSGGLLTAAEATSPEYWVQHLRRTVRFGPALSLLLRQPGGGVLLEVGPGRSLSALARRAVAQARLGQPKLDQSQLSPAASGDREGAVVRVVASMPRSETADESGGARRAAAELWLAGGALDWQRVGSGQRRRVPLPATAFDDHRYWVLGSDHPATGGDRQLLLHRPTWIQAGPISEGSVLEETGFEEAGFEEAGFQKAGAASGAPRHWLIVAGDAALEELLSPALGFLGTSRRWLAAADLRDRDPDGVVELLRPATGAADPSGVLWLGPGWSPAAAADEASAGEGGAELLGLARGLARHPEAVAEVVVLTRGQEEVFGDEPVAPGAWVPRATARALARAGIPARTVDLPSTPFGSLGDRGLEDLLRAALSRRSEAAGERTALRGSFRWRAETQALELGEEAAGGAEEWHLDGAAILLTGAQDPSVLALALELTRRHPLRLALLFERTEGEGETRPSTAAENSRRELEERAEQLWSATVETRPGEAPAAALTRVVREAASALGGVDLWIHRRRPGTPGPLRDLEVAAAFAVLGEDARELGALAELARELGIPAGVLLHDLGEIRGDDPLASLRAEQTAEWARRQADANGSGGAPGTRWRALAGPLAVAGGAGGAGGERWAELLERSVGWSSEAVALVAPRDPDDWFADPPAATEPPARGFRPPTSAPFEAPAGESEARLAAIWEQLLGVSPVGRHDDFFELGGHSLLATQVMARVRQELGLEVSLRTFFDAPTVAALAAAVEHGGGGQGGTPAAPPLVPVPRDRPLALSFAQQRLWFLDQLEPGSPVYNLPFGLRLSGRLRSAALSASFTALVRRHEVLRTRFESLRGTPHQVIAQTSALPLPAVDLSALPAARREAEAKRLAAAEARRPFALDRGPMIRVLLLRLAREEHRLTVTLHHIAADGWSLGVVVREVGALYRALSEGAEPDLPVLPVQYADFAVWQRQWLAGKVLEAQLDHWRRRLENLGTVELPTDRPRPAMLSPWGGEVRFTLPPELGERLRSVGRGAGATPFMVLLAAFKALLQRLTGQRDVVVGSPVAGRTRIETEGLIGFFVNTLVLRTDTGGDPPLRQLVDRVRDTSLEAQAHQDVPFELLVQELQPERDLSRSPLFQVLFILQNTPLDALELPEISLLPWDLETGAAPFDLTLSMSERGDSLAGTFSFRHDLFDRTTVERWSGAFHRLLAAAVAEPSAPLSHLSSLSVAEHHQLTRELAPGPPPSPVADSLPERLLAVADRRAEAVAVLAGDTVTTYGELRDRSLRLAQHLRALELGAESPVGVALERTADMVVALWAVMAAGYAFVPLDPRHPTRRLTAVVEDAGVELLLTDGRNAEVFEGFTGRTLVLDEDGAEWLRSPVAATAATLAPASLAYVLYTSGSTGRPKGVEISHGALIGFLDAMARRPGLGAGDTLAAITTLSFDISLLEIFLPLITGGRLLLVSSETTADPHALARRLESAGATVMQATPAGWHQLLESGWTNARGLRVLCGGEALPRSLANRLLATAPEVWNLYGPTEATVWIAVAAVRATAGAGAGGEKPETGWPVELGRPLPGARLEILDPLMRPVPLGVGGELWLAGPGLARGYRGLPARTAATFLPDPGSSTPGGRIYRSGDLVRRDGRGRLIFLGRTDHQVKVRGFRIEVGEVEAALLRHPSVRQAVVVARHGEGGDARLVAYLATSAPADSAQDAEAATVRDLRAFLAEHLPAYMVPTAFVLLDTLPTTTSGKVDRKALPEPERTRPAGAPFVAPRDPVEETVAEIWCEVLHLPKLGVDDNFFELGGHSLLATQVTSRIFEAFRLELPLRRLFADPTVAGLATAIRQAQAESLDEGEEELLRRIEGMSEEGIDEALAELLAGDVEES